MKTRNALKLILQLHRNPDCSTDTVNLAPMTLRQIKDALTELDANDPRVRIVRSDPKVGKGTCTSIDEAMTDTELVDAMNEDEVTAKTARTWARGLEELWLEKGLNQRWGADDDPQLKAYNDFVNDDAAEDDHNRHNLLNGVMDNR